jgi:hypothetical protein
VPLHPTRGEEGSTSVGCSAGATARCRGSSDLECARIRQVVDRSRVAQGADRLDHHRLGSVHAGSWRADRSRCPSVNRSVAPLFGIRRSAVDLAGSAKVVIATVCTPDELADWPIDQCILLDCSDAERRSRLAERPGNEVGYVTAPDTADLTSMPSIRPICRCDKWRAGLSR